MGDFHERDRIAAPWLLLGVAGVAFIVLFQLTSGLTFFADEWNVILRPDWSADSLFEPLNEHIYFGPVVIYKVLLAVFGMDSTGPFRVVNILLLLLVAGLVFAFVRARLGDAIALLVAVVVLFLGPSWENLLWPAGISFLGATAAGLGAFLALERESTRGDISACVLLVVSTAFSSLGLVFAVGAAVDVVLRGDRRLERALIPGVPIVLYLIWYAVYGHEAESPASWDNLLEVPLYVWNAASAAVASLVGLTGISDESLGVNAEFGRPLLVVGGALAVWTAARSRQVLSRQFWVFLLSGLAFWASAGLNAIPGREPGASRYQLIGAVFVILIAAELSRGRRLSRGWLGLAAVLAATAVLANIGALRAGERFFRSNTDANLAALAAIEGAREQIDDQFVFDPAFPGTPFPQPVAARDYFSAVDRWGSPVGDLEAAVNGTEPARQAADTFLAAVLGLSANAATDGEDGKDCASVQADPQTGLAAVELPDGGALIRTESQLDGLRLRRWSESDYPIDLGPAPGPAIELATPLDGFSEPWTAELTSSGRIKVCPLA